MYMGKPILTSDLPFARTVCGDAAIYFNPLSAEDIVAKIENLLSSKTCYEDLKNRGFIRLKEFCGAEERALQYLNICKRISNNNEQ